MKCRHCDNEAEEEDVCDACYHARAPLWEAYWNGDGPDPTDLPTPPSFVRGDVQHNDGSQRED